MILALVDGQIRMVILIGYMGLLLFLGYFASRLARGTKSDYLLASHSIGPFLLLMSMFGTTMTAFALVGSTGAAYKGGIGVYGLLASASGIVHSLCFFLVGIKIYRHGRKYGYSTQIQFFRERLESDFLGILLFPILIALLIPYLLIGVIAGGKVISVMTQGAFAAGTISADGSLPPWVGALIICLVVLTYVFMGGMRGTAWANAFQTTVFMVLGVITFYLLATKMGKGETFFDSVKNLNLALDETKSTRQSMSPSMYLTYMLIPLSVAMFPHLFQHWLTAKSAKTFRLPVIMHPIFIMIVWAPCVLIGVWATTLDGPMMAENAVLAILVNTQIGPIMGGFLSAGILAAIMSSLDSQFLCIGTMFANDVVVHYAGKDRISDRGQIGLARGFIVVVVGITFALSFFASASVFDLAIWCFSGFAGLFPVVIAALYWRRLTAAGAVSGTLAMLGSWIYLFHQSDWGVNKGFMVYVTKELPVMPVTVIILCSSVAMVASSLLTTPPSQATLDKFFDRENHR